MPGRTKEKKLKFYPDGVVCDNCFEIPHYTNHCGKKITTNCRAMHINISNTPQKHYFCNEDCKYEWIIRGGKGR